MKVYRICAEKYADDLMGTGAYMFGGRWNEKEYYMLYTAAHISLATLEILVNLSYQHSFIKTKYSLLTLELPDENFFELPLQQLPRYWKEKEWMTNKLGTEFLREGIYLYQKVPSAIIEEEHNILINPKHPLFKKVKVLKRQPFNFDKRLLNKQ